jgi:hypothetical protein
MMVTSFNILVKLAAIQTNAINAAKTPVPVAGPGNPKAPATPALDTSSNFGIPKPLVSPGTVASSGNKKSRTAITPIKPVTSDPMEVRASYKEALDTQSALMGLGAGVGGFALGKAFVEPALTNAAGASPWLIGALAALVVGSMAANAARKDENQKVHLEHALANMSPAERQLALEMGNQQELGSVGFRSGAPVQPSRSMHRSFY